MRRATVLMVLLLAASLPAPADALVRATVVATDPAGDQAIVAPQVANPASPPPAYANVDLTALLAQGTDTVPGDEVTLLANVSAPPTARQTVTFSFNVTRGPDSAPSSTASGAHHEVSVTGTTVTGAAGATAVASGRQVGVRLPYSSIGASPGDVLADLAVTATDQDGGPTSGGPLPDTVAADDSSARDRAPDQGGAAYTLEPLPFQSNLTVAVAGGELRDANGTRPFDGATASTRDGNATVRFDLRITNRAAKPDAVQAFVNLAPPQGAAASFPATPIPIAPGQTVQVGFTVQLAGVPPGTLAYAPSVAATAGQFPFTATVVVLPPPPPGHRAIPAALGFLTPAATAVGLDGPFGNYAELALLLFLLLLAVVLLFLALFLVRTPWLRVAVEPRRALAAPGGVAEFRIRLDRARRGVAAAKAVLRSAPWASAFRFRGGPAPEGAGTVRLDPANPAEGILRVEVPAGTPSLERETVAFDIVPLDADGAEMPRHRAHGHVTVQALQPAGIDPRVPKARDIRLAAVRHDPPDPLPGGTVTTTATIHNDGAGPAGLRIVLLLDGHPVVEERVEVAGRSTREVGLPWTAGAGKNQVKVQVFLA